MAKEQHYIYLHRDENGNPIYVGRGKDAIRSVTHDGDDLSKFLESNKCFVEIAGPFHDLDIASVVEAALISAFRGTSKFAEKLINKSAGVSRGTFRPLGVPFELAQRIAEPEIDRDALLATTAGAPVLFVYIRDKPTGDGRAGYDLANVPSNQIIRERMIKSWQLGRKIEEWRSSPEKTPHLLAAVTGPIKHRVIVGCLPIDRARMVAASQKPVDGLYEVPIADHPDNELLNYGNLRGRRLLPGLTKFGSIKPMFFSIVD